MRLSPERFIIPLLVSFSLTGAGVLYLYVLNKKKEEDASNKKIEEISVDFKIPHKSVPMIIGRAGIVIQSIQESTNTKISFKEETEIHLPERTCVISGYLENVKAAENAIKRILEDQPIIETYETWVPQRTINSITEKNGKVLNQIQNTSNTKVILEDFSNVIDLDAQKRVILKGTAEQIANALTQIEDKVREDKELQANNEISSLNRIPRIKTPPVTVQEDDKNVDQPTDMIDNQDKDGWMDVFVCSVENPSQFYIQKISPVNAMLDHLVGDMTDYYELEENHESHVLTNISEGQIVAAKFLLDHKWYRAEIVSDAGNQKYDVYFVDFGDRATVESKDILELRTDFLGLRFQAIECSLSGVKPCSGEWSAEAIYKFGQLCAEGNWMPRMAKTRGYKERTLGCGPCRREGSPIPCIELYKKKDEQLINIGKELIKLELACAENEPWSAASSTVSLSMRARSPEAASNGATSNDAASNGAAGNDNGPNKSVEEIDLTVTPKSKTANVEVIDLTTPIKTSKKMQSRSFIEYERSLPVNGNKNRKALPVNPFRRESKTTLQNAIPAGYEDDAVSEDDDDFSFN